MEKMTKAQIQQRQNAIMNRMDEIEVNSRKANNGQIVFTADEDAEFTALLRESEGLSARAKALASEAELAKIRENEEKGKQLRESIRECYQKRSAATTVLANVDSTNATGNLEAGGLIPVTINEIIDTKVPV